MSFVKKNGRSCKNDCLFLMRCAKVITKRGEGEDDNF